MRTSYSALETFKQCPQRYKFQNIERVREPKSKEAVFGTLVHSGLHYMFSKDPLFPTLDEVINHFRTAWQNADKLNITDAERKAYLDQGEHILKRFYEKNPPWNFNVADLESRFEVSIEDPKTNETHTLAGIMDRIDKPTDDTYEIIDYKTARKMKSQESLNDDLQLSLYYLGLTRRWPHINPDNIRLSLQYVKHNEKLTTTRKKEDLDHIKETVLETIRAIETSIKEDAFPAQPTPLCDWCGYKAICPAWKFLYTKKAVIEPPIEEILTEFFALKKQSTRTTKRIAELQTHIKTYMEKEGVTRVFGAEGIVAKKLQERFTYNFDKVKEILTAAGRMDIWELLLSPDEKVLKKIVKELPPQMKHDIEDTKELVKRFDVLTISTKVEEMEEGEVEET
ncbi:MAG: hypothetical protein COU90_04670 [Candidatus Ryanbacteria bacterium CG10_big_fil_rev_8_21_14_0_10_43_42]|uniref:PD-(D/E)XK endonuclease-like domain-containing protein n=1 Tax=Candidatus Ryanbacteria bacterium CG10_big_fil_rev_8_21_14_0_10_43_42 TaxID=1974864 RepID=A0A2M8KW24_9BACT|nr:MAG: hypothetical protein COU90_04670 [Candidatus Ryanbacteria bacterium CG10_big_fil_rev_8_21_14_0_10_43_42]